MRMLFFIKPLAFLTQFVILDFMMEMNFNVRETVSRAKMPGFLLLLLLILPFHFYPQDQWIHFQHITMKQGLSNSTIYCIFQDSRGFLWLGTDNGVNRYDGCSFKTYRNQMENPGSLSQNTVRAIIEDRSGALWIGTFGGLNRFDPKKETFTHYQKDPGNPNSLGHNFILSLLADRWGNLWIGTYGGGLDRFSPRTGTFTHYRTVPGDSSSLSDNNVRRIYEDRWGNLWIGTYNGGLNKFLPQTGTFTRYQADPSNPNSLGHNTVLTIGAGPQGLLWIGTLGGGLDRFSPETGTFTHFRAEAGNPKTLSNNDVMEIYWDRSGVLWVGTGWGLNRFDPKKEEFTHYLADPNVPDSLSANKVRSIYEDRSGVLWIGTEFGSLNKFNRERKKFKHYTCVPGDSTSLSSSMVTALYEDRRGFLWVGTDEGLNKGERKNNRFTFTHYRHKPQGPSSLSSDRVWSLCEDRSGQLWVGTLKGLNRMDREAGKFTRYLADPQNPNSLSGNRIMSICEDHRGVLWIGTFNGLNRFDPVKGVFTHFQEASDPSHRLSNNQILSIYEDRTGVMWVGTGWGLNRFDSDTGIFTYFLAKPGHPRWLSSDKINAIYEDRSGILWFGTSGGLNRYDRETKFFTHYDVKRGLPSDVILGILEDKGGHLWLSTNDGLSRFDPKTGTFKNYDSGDGLQDEEFGYACWKSKDGEMFFGGINGFNAFIPGTIKDNPYPPGVVITDFKISNKSVGIGEKWNGEIILENHISETGEIRLSYRETTLSFDYVALHFAAPESNRYAYRMEGLEKEWNYVGNRRFAIYPHMDPGNYVFRVIASNNDNVWNHSGASLIIHISPPFWRQWWFRGLSGGIILMILSGGYYYRTRWLRAKLAEQEQVQKQLTQSRDEMEKARDLAEFRSVENEKLIAAISSIFITVNAQGKISQWNSSTEKFFNIPGADVKEHLLTNVLKGYIPAGRLDEIIEMGLHRDKATNNIELPVNFKEEGKLKLLLTNINPIVDKNGKNFGFLLLAEDITHRQKEQMRMLLSQKLEALGQMAAGIAHEIRSPLQYIGDNARFLLESFGLLLESCGDIREKIKNAVETGRNIDLEKLNRSLAESDFDFFLHEIPGALDHIVNGIVRVSNIVKSMNEFSYSGDGVYEKSDLNEMLKTTLVVVHNRIKKVAELQTDYAPGLPPVYGGRGELNQVFLNLLINAADAVAETGKRGLIKISTRQQGRESIVEISDNGIGIPAEIRDKIFTPFFTTKKIGHGTGQGLHYSYGIIVERHKGKLYFKSKVNEGTTFFIHLPNDEDSGESSPSSAKE
jgi:PAS domain S-box-containing protein